MRREPAPGTIAFRCPGCTADSSATGREFDLGNPFFKALLGDLVRPTAMLARATAWSAGYFADGERAECTRCRAPVRVRPYERPAKGLTAAERRGLYAECRRCGEVVSSSAGALALAHPDGRRFLRDHPRIQAAPVRELEAEGVPALVIGHRAVLGRAQLDVVVARDTLRILGVHRTAA